MGEEKRGSLTIDLTADLDKLKEAVREVVREEIAADRARFASRLRENMAARGVPIKGLAVSPVETDLLDQLSPPFVRLPKDEIVISWEPAAPYFVVGAYTRDFGEGPCIIKTKMSWAAVPNGLVDIDDLKRAGAYDAYRAAISRPVEA
jgi:hypothetical protein